MMPQERPRREKDDRSTAETAMLGHDYDRWGKAYPGAWSSPGPAGAGRASRRCLQRNPLRSPQRMTTGHPCQSLNLELGRGEGVLKRERLCAKREVLPAEECLGPISSEERG